MPGEQWLRMIGEKNADDDSPARDIRCRIGPEDLVVTGSEENQGTAMAIEETILHHAASGADRIPDIALLDNPAEVIWLFGHRIGWDAPVAAAGSGHTDV